MRLSRRLSTDAGSQGGATVAMVPSCGLVYQDDEQNRVLEFCKACVEQEKAGSLYVCGCPGTGKTLLVNKVKESLVRWADEMDMETPDELAINCTHLGNTSDIFGKIVARRRETANCCLFSNFGSCFLTRNQLQKEL